MGQRTFLALISWLHLSIGVPHHGGPHYFGDTRPEHRSMMLAEADTFQSRMGLQWPDSKNHWADVPTGSQAFPDQDTMLEKYQSPEEQPSSTSLDSRFDIISDSEDFDKHISSIHGKRHSPSSSHNFFNDQPDYGSQFQYNPIFQAKTPPFDSFRPSGFDYQVNYEERDKRNSQSPRSPTNTRFTPPTFDKFRPADFTSISSQSRPIRHTSFPASSFSAGDDDDGHLGAPESASSNFGLKPFGNGKGQIGSSHSYTTFEAPKVNSNVFIDHRQEEIKRPARASAPSFQPPRPQLRPNNFLPSHQVQKNYPFTTLQKHHHDDDSDNVDVYDYLEGEIDLLNGLNLGFENGQKQEKQNLNSAVDDINGSPDYNSYSLPTRYEYTEADPEEAPFEFRGRGRHHDERYDRENREESGKRDVRNYRTPIEPIRYEAEDPVEITHFGDSYGGVQTFKGGYDSEEDAKRGIQRNFDQEQPSEQEIYQIEGEPLEDYNRDGYYVPLQDRRRSRPYHPELEEDSEEEEWRSSPEYYNPDQRPEMIEPEDDEEEEDEMENPRRNLGHLRRNRGHRYGPRINGASMNKRNRQPTKEGFDQSSSQHQPFWASPN